MTVGELARRTGMSPKAIREFEGGQPRADAERDALDDVRAAHRKGPRSAGSHVEAADAKKHG